ncbi:MAG: helix-turn-helix domain-containing protein, partial [Pygmaiobacter massiliensis]|nr:helix-turn-helix domain-containing protein [Pygmaiobacter massiliensis]
MPLNAVVREKRKELGLTQEQVADYLGVTAPAVHKWEKGATYPDVALLPALARLLKIDLNTLLCFHEELSQKEIGLFLNRVTEVFHREGFETALALAMEKVREYPANAGLLHSLAMVLQGSLMMTDFPVQQKESYEAQIIALYERVVDCNDPKYSSQASYMLASRLITAKEYEKAQERLDALPEPNALDRRTLQARLWMQTGKSEDAA